MSDEQAWFEHRIAELEEVVSAQAELIRHIGQTLSWSSAGARLNDPPLYIREAQRSVERWHEKVKERREAQTRQRSQEGPSLLEAALDDGLDR